MTSQQPSIFDFIDYRAFLIAYYNWHKENTKGFSHRLLAQSLGFTSPNFLKLVMDGKRNISKEAVEKIAYGLGFKKKEAEYFSYITFFTQAKNNVEKNYYFGLIAALRSSRNIVSLDHDQFEYFSEWYHPAVRELVKGKKGPLDFSELSEILGKKVSVVKIKSSLELLTKLGFIVLDESNCYRQAVPLLNTKNELQTAAIRQYHKQVLDYAKKAIDEVVPEQREISHATVNISAKGYEKIKQRIQEFREEILQITADDTDCNKIYHANFQFYPVTRIDIKE
jgi:uncharacterized protein (TIGR02147 family)